MKQELDSLHAFTTTTPFQYYYLNADRAAQAASEIDQHEEHEQHVLRTTYALELLYAGQTEKAIEQLKILLESVDPQQRLLTAESRKLTDLLAVAYLRLGEQQNCIENHGASSCILPIQADGFHTLITGSKQATSTYERLLERYSTDYRARWLLNVAYATLGQHPARVPESLLIPGISQTETTSFPRFTNISGLLGLNERQLAGSIAMEDFNNDGWLDLFVTAHRLSDRVQLFLNNGQGGFEDHTTMAGLAGLAGGLNLVHADYNNDGFEDIFILRGAWLGALGTHPNSLLHNNGDGTFKDVTVESGLLSYHPTQTAAWADFNNDGWLDLFVGNERSNRWLSAWQQSSAADDGKRHASELFMNNGDGTFTDVAPLLGLDVELFVKGVAWGDVNNDGLQDLYLSVMGGPNRFFLNRGGENIESWQFEEMAGEAGIHEPFFSFPTWFWDQDNDGWLDLCVGNSDLRRLDHAAADLAREYLGLSVHTEMPRIYRNLGKSDLPHPAFEDITAEAGMNRVLYAMGGNFGDLNNDGFDDAYFGTGAPDYRSLVPNRMFLNNDGKTFNEVTLAGGFGHLQKGHGIAFGDLDRDGDQDIFAVMGGAYEGDVFQNALFENPGVDPDAAWTTIELEGRTANRSAIGARVRLTVEMHNGAARDIHRVVSTGGSFGSSSLQLEIGLGNAVRIKEIEITWPNAAQTQDVHRDIEVRRHYLAVEGLPLTALERPSAPFKPVESDIHNH